MAWGLFFSTTSAYKWVNPVDIGGILRKSFFFFGGGGGGGGGKYR